MTMSGTRSGFTCLLLGLALLAGVASTADAALPRTYAPQKVDSANPTVGGALGQGLVSALGDLDRDGKDDLLVPQSTTGPNGDGQLFVYSGRTGAVIDTVNAPDAGGASAKAGFGFFSGSIADIGSCAGGTSGQTCGLPLVGGDDGVRDILVGATGIDVATPGAPAGTAVDIGRAYVLDGATRAILKRIEMPADQRAEQANVPAPIGRQSPGFGRTVFSPAGLPPCAGSAGIGACPTLAEMPAAVRIGDRDGNGRADLVIGASAYFEAGPATNPACDPGPCRGAGRTYLVPGEEIAGTNPATPLEAPQTLKSPVAQSDELNTVNSTSELFGHTVAAVGDVGRCTNAATAPGARCAVGDTTVAPDGRPEVLVSAFRTDLFPSATFFDVGVNLLIDGATGAVLYIYQHPEPQSASIFGFTLHNEPAAGNLGGDALPDLFIPAMRQNVDFTAQGRGYVMNGNYKSSPNSINFSQLNDPTPAPGGNFGVSSAGVGDVVGDAASPNEILVGAFGPHNPGVNTDVINDVHFFDVVQERVLQSIADPDQQPGSSFGTAVAPLGDLNDDGFLDLAVAADLYDGAVGKDEGRFYLLRSDNSPAPATPTESGTTPAGPASGPAAGVPSTTTTSVAASGRTVDLVPSKRRVRRGDQVSMNGSVEAFADAPGCERGVQVDLQRRSGGARYSTFERVTTSATGTFSTRTRPTRTATYRARVSQTDQCLGDVSGREDVAVGPRVLVTTPTARLTSDNRVRLQVRCDTADAPCNGTIRLRTSTNVRGSRVTLGTAAFQTPGNARRFVRIPVSSRSRKQLRGLRQVKVRAFVIGRDSLGNSTTAVDRLTVRLR